MANVFISYKRENKDAVQAIVQGLRSAGLSVWWDQDIAADAPWEATIERELEEAKVVLVAWSRASVASENVKAEARRARTQGKLIQSFVEPCDPPLFFGERQGIDLSSWNGDVNDHRFKVLIGAVRAVLAGRKPQEGVGYAPRRKSAAPLVLGVFIVLLVAAIAAFVVAPERVRATACSATGVWCSTSASVDGGAEAAAPAATPVSPASNPPALQAGIEHRLEIPTGAAIDLDTGTVSAEIVAGSDFVLVGGDGDYFIDHIDEPAGTQRDMLGTPSRAVCARGEYFYRNYLAEPGEYNCFRTGERREGALMRQRDRAGFDGVVITYRFWE